MRCLEKPINPDTLVYVLDEAVEMAVEQYAQHDLLSVWSGEGVARDRRPRILFVDDDPQVLAGLSHLMRRRRDVWEMDFVCGGAMALDRLTKTPFDVFVSDMRMPVIDGRELRRRSVACRPGTEFIIFSGKCDGDEVAALTADGIVYVAKPVPHEILATMIQDCLDYRACLDVIAS